MKKTLAVLTALSTMFVMSSFANAGSKASANINKLGLFSNADHTGTHSFDPILSSQLHTGSKKDLLIGVSLETGLYTDTLVRSKGGVQDTSNATAGIRIIVKVDGIEAQPGVVIFDKRSQTLSATLGGYFANCVDANNDGITDMLTECDLLDEEIDLILDTMAAHHFNFVYADLPAGDHTIEVLTEVTGSTSAQNGSASAYGTLGKGSLTVEEIQDSNAEEEGIVLQ